MKGGKWGANKGDPATPGTDTSSGDGVEKRNGKWMMSCKSCGWNETHTSRFHGKWDKVKVMSALKSKIESLMKVVTSDSPREDEGILKKMECEMLIKKLLSMVDQTKKDLKMSSWLHMPPTSFEYQYYELLRKDYEADGYRLLGMIASLDQTEASYKRSITNYQKAQAICNLLGMEDGAKSMDNLIAFLTDRLDRLYGDGVNVAVNASSLLNGAMHDYEYSLKRFGSTSEATLRSGSTYVSELVH